MNFLGTAFSLAALSTCLHAQEISPLLFGQNHWLAQGDENRTGYLHLLWPKVKASGVQLVRIGGHEYEVHPPSIARWTAMVDSVQAIGAEPLVQVPRQFSAGEAANLVKQLNRPGRRAVRWWSIGNEPMLHDETTLDGVYAFLMRIVPAMKAADPSIKILVFDEAWMRQEAYEALCGGRLDITGQDAAGRWLVDGFSYHSYPNGEKFERSDVTTSGVARIRDQTKALLVLIARANEKHGRTGDAQLRWALTEFNVTYLNPGRNVEGIGNPSFVGGQFFAEIFGLGMEYGALTIAPWAISETDDPKTDFGYLGLPPDFSPRSSYYHEQMLAHSMRGTFMPTRSNQPLVKVIGAKSASGVSVMVLNEKQTQEFPFELTLALKKAAPATQLLDVQADAALPGTTTGTIAPQTTLLFEFDHTGKLLRKTTYDLGRNLRNLPPTVETFAGEYPDDYEGKPFDDARHAAEPQKIPGTVWCAYYDRGGEGIAYHDSDAVNNGSGKLNPANGDYLNEFRKGEAVDISYTKYHNDVDRNPFNHVQPAEGMLYVGWTEPGEWLKLTVDVATAGTYAADILYAAAVDGQISIDVNQKPATPAITLRSTYAASEPIAWRNWHHWALAQHAVTLTLPKGRSVLTLHIESGGNMNLCTLEFKPQD